MITRSGGGTNPAPGGARGPRELLRFGLSREADDDDGALAGRAAADEEPAAVVLLHHPARQRQSQPPAPALGGIPRLERASLLGQAHPPAVVAHHDLRPAALGAGSDRDLDRA